MVGMWTRHWSGRSLRRILENLPGGHGTRRPGQSKRRFAMTIPPMEVPPSRATNAAVPVPPGSDVDLSVDPDDARVESGSTPPPVDDGGTFEQTTDQDR
jgi:hypothetical protein